METPLTTALLTRVASLRKHAARELENQCALKLSEYRILSLLDMQSFASTRDMQEYLSSGQSTVSESFARLKRENAVAEDAGYPYCYALTPKGKGLLAEGDEAVERAVRLAFEGVPADLYLANKVGALLNMAPLKRIRMRDRGYFSEFSLFECTLLAEEKCIEASRRHGLSFVEFKVLLALREASGRTGMRDLAAGLDASLAHVSEACAALAGKSLVAKEEDLLDKRRRLVRLTPEGSALARVATPDVAAALYEVTANRLSEKEREAAFMLSQF